MTYRSFTAPTVAILATIAHLAGGCSSNIVERPCMTVDGASSLVSGATHFRLDVYDSGTRCAGDRAAPDSGLPLLSHLYGKDQRISLDVPAGTRAVVLTTFADAQGTMPLGQACVVADLSPGAQICFDLTVHAVGDMSPAVDMGFVASNCPGSTFLLCDGFEDAALNPRWGTYLVSGTADVDGTRAYRGASSFHAHIEPNGARAHGTAFTMLAYPIPDVYVRAFAYVPTVVNTAADFVTVIQQPAPYASVNLSLENGSLSTYDGADGKHIVATTPVPLARWVCLEWRIHFDATNGYTQLWIDGQPVTVAGTENTLPTPFYYFFRIGLESNTTVARDLWLDEVAVDAAVIGCAR